MLYKPAVYRYVAHYGDGNRVINEIDSTNTDPKNIIHDAKQYGDPILIEVEHWVPKNCGKWFKSAGR